jgi:hypothetical protein
MRINEYYRDAANLSLNGSIAALFPAIFIIGGNLSFFQNKEIMLLTVPFLVYSLICFQVYLYKKKRSISIGKNMLSAKSSYQSIFGGNNLLVVSLNTKSPVLQLYFPDGYKAGELKRLPQKGIRFTGLSKWYALYDFHRQIIGYFKVKGSKTIKIEVYSQNKEYLGCYAKKQLGLWKNKKDLLDASGKLIGTVQGSSIYMDEQIRNHRNVVMVRLRRGWMPLEWEKYFPEPNTPVLSFKGGLTQNDKLLTMSLLINEYFIER